MKTAKLFTATLALTLVALLALPSLSMASGGNQLNDAKLAKGLKKIMKFPSFAKSKKYKAMVYVSFTVTEEGKVNIVSMDASDEQIKTYVEEKLNELDLEHLSGTTENPLVYKFTFDRK